VKYTQDNVIVNTRKYLFDLIFIAMESLHLSYQDIMIMPYSLLLYLVEEKIKLSEKIQSELDNKEGKELKVNPFYWSE